MMRCQQVQAPPAVRFCGWYSHLIRAAVVVQNLETQKLCTERAVVMLVH
jgi:hypothetical protein